MFSRSANLDSSVEKAGFSIKDIIVVLACLSLLTILQLSVFGHGKGRNRLTLCLANFQQMSRAWLIYAEDNDSKLVWNADGSSAGKNPSRPSWAGGWLDFAPGNSDNTNTSLLTGSNPFGTNYGGLLGPYLSSPLVFRCPEDWSFVTTSGIRYPRNRSVSMNSFMGGMRPDGTRNSWNWAQLQTFVTVNDFSKLKPSSAYVFVDEREESINDSTFIVNLNANLDANDSPNLPNLEFVDYPAGRHDTGAALSFADGHVEYWRWTDPRTLPVLMPGFRTPSPGNQDMARLSKATSSH